jgi:hypothetical protein
VTSLALAYLSGIFTTIAALHLSRRLAEHWIAKENERRDEAMRLCERALQDKYVAKFKVVDIGARKTSHRFGLGGKERA